MNQKKLLQAVSDIHEKYYRHKSKAEITQSSLDIDEIHELVIYPEREVYIVKNVDLEVKEIDGIKYRPLGKYIEGENLILISSEISEKYDPRRPFVTAHELGHSEISGAEEEFFIEGVYSNDDVEIAANAFAKFLLMPFWLLKHHFINSFGDNPLVYSGPAVYCFHEKIYGDRQRTIYEFSHFCGEVARNLSQYFSHVSKQALGLRLYETGFIRNRSNQPFSLETPHLKRDFNSINNILDTIKIG